MNTNPAPQNTSQRQFVFISDGRLQEAPTVRSLLKPLVPITVGSSSQSILERFLVDPTLYALPVVDQTGRPVALIDRKQLIEFFSKSYSREIFGRRTITDLLHYEDYTSNQPIVVEDHCSVEDVAQIIIHAGMQHMVTGFIVCRDGRYLGVANGHDLLNVITQRKQAELYYLAHYDALTGLPNRTLLADRLEQACLEADRKQRLVALLFIDIDRFKQINDSLGHSAGDAVLRQIVDRLKSAARLTDTVARLAGDEFVILMEDIAAASHVDVVAQRVVSAMQEPLELLGHRIIATVSVGTAIYPTDDTNRSALLAKADAAMYEAKVNGRNAYCKYMPGTEMYNPEKMLLENDLRMAIEQNQLTLLFQPQVLLSNQELRGVEALVRWRHPTRGMIPPIEFIPIAEESGLIVPLGAWVLRQSLAQLREWLDHGLPSLRISVNISARQIFQRDFPEFVADQLNEFRITPSLVELELTESTLMHHADDVLKTLEEIKALGVSLAIDDFGTGFSSLSYLRRFPIDRLKIDQSFVRDIEHTPANESIARAIVALANSLSLDIIAEGIETPSERAVLEQLHCTEGQGYLFAKPLTADAIGAWLKAPQMQCQPALP